SILKGIVDDLFAPRTTDEFETLHHVIGLAVLNARVQVLFVFANDNHIHCWTFRINKWKIGNTGPDVGIESKGGAYCDVETFVSTALRCSNGGLEKDFGASQ